MEVVGSHGVSFRKGDEQDLKAQLTWLLENPDQVQAYRDTAAEYIINHYNWDRVVDQMLEIYKGNLIEYQNVVGKEPMSFS